MTVPLLFLDVDGPLLPFGGSVREYAGFAEGELSNPLLARVNPTLGPRLLALGCHLVWATTWMEEANECIAPLLGLPALPVMIWPEFHEDDHDARIGLHWKTRQIVDQAGESPSCGSTTRSPISTGHGWQRDLRQKGALNGSRWTRP